MFPRVLTIWAIILALNSFAFADDKAKRDRDAAAALDLQLSLMKPKPFAAPEPVDGVKVIVGYCVGDRCFILRELSPEAEEKEVQAAFEAAADKARKATKTDAEAEDLEAWSISEDIDPVTGGVFALADAEPDLAGTLPPGWTCDENGCYRRPAVKLDRPANCTCGEDCPCVAFPPVSAGSPLTTFSSFEFRTIADRPRLFRFDGGGPVRSFFARLFRR